MVTCSIAEQRNIRRDVSYFKTSSPGTATTSIAATAAGGELRVLLFFPPVNEVKEEVRGYFHSLKQNTGNLVVESLERMRAASLAKKHRVTKDGTIVLVHGDKSEKISISTDIQRARRSDLRNVRFQSTKGLDQGRPRQKSCLFDDRSWRNKRSRFHRSRYWPKMMRSKARVIRQILEALNYNVKDLGPHPKNP